MFIFSLAKELKKTVRQIETEMDAAELMEWVAYFKATDEDSAKLLQAQIAEEQTDHEKAESIRSFLNTLKGSRK